MPRLSAGTPALRRPSGGERVFSDARGRLWSAAQLRDDPDNAIVFACISDGRQSGRAISVELSLQLPDVADETLRSWLDAAPRIGLLS
ncbi:MAG: hypothetical protein JWO05_177 [Gemmatimonadetes bacterium]|nr:hypothetical protein [Gemmatimonadota bacterium]